MIHKEFNNGWGDDVPLKQFESQILSQYLKPWAEDSSNTVIINNTWYSKEFHSKVCEELSANPPDRVILTSMLDAAIVDHTWFESVCQHVSSVGYYRGPDTIDFWALAVDKYFQRPDCNLMQANLIDCAYMSLNRKPHWHRLRLYESLSTMQLLDRGLVSMGSNQGTALRLLPQDQGISQLAPNADTAQNGISNDIMSLGHAQNWQKHFLNIVTETWWDLDSTYFVSEKIYKPIVGFRPFLVYAKDGGCNWLTKNGFEHYCRDFQDITDLELAQPDNIPKFLEILCDQPKTYWQSKFVALKEKILYNNYNFSNYVVKIKNKISKGIACQI
jgi:hypothetical protein